jgi:ABC-type transport system substrate-binding protein
MVANDAVPPALPRIAESLQLMLEAAEIPIQIRVEPEAVVRAAREKGEHELLVAESAVDGGDPHLFLYPLSTSEGASKGPQASNFSFYRNPRLDDVLIRASQIAFRPERRRLYQRAQAMLADEVPWVPLYVRLVWAVARPEVRGLRLHPTGFHRLTTVALEGPS